MVLYGKATATTYFVKGKVLDFDAVTAVDLTFPAWVTDTLSDVDVSDLYVYVRNKVDKAGTSDRYHGAFYISNNALKVYNAPVALTAT